MGSAAERFADRIVITSDNPRHESPEAIVEDIVGGLENPQSASVIVDRRAAIAHAIGAAAADDLVLIAGKGHEQEQQIGDTRLPFSDTAVATSVLSSEVAS
jgi:UDP-N-acetylmuramoyl-L-alanyl-D-glutamate--2,6-diaminopimelate ligase